jgi:hypothetical protein
MGTLPYKMLDTKFRNLEVNTDNIALEIGSERGEGSSLFIGAWAKNKGIPFYSVDVVEHAKTNFDNENINFEVAITGHAWCRDILPTLNKKIKVLYLDNFDWTDPNNLIFPWLHELIESYANRGVVMNNENSQEEHRMQALYCIPYMDEQSIVLFDDTWKSHITPSGYDGKSGTAIPLFIEAGFEVHLDATFGLYAIRNYSDMDRIL